jgi:hypothetical protein
MIVLLNFRQELWKAEVPAIESYAGAMESRGGSYGKHRW